MKIYVGLLVACLTVGGVFSLPAGTPNDDAEVIDVPRRQVLNRHKTDDAGDSSAGDPDFTSFNGVIDTGAGYPFLQPHPLPFSFNLGFFDAFEDIFRRLREQLNISNLPSDGDSLSSFDTSKGNTTSTVKIVDGHKFEVNETVYGDENSFFKMRLVNIRPVDSDEDAAETTESNTNALNPVTSAPNKNNFNTESDERREPLEKKPLENEITRNIDDEPEAFANLIFNISKLPIINENNTVNLYATFATDNSLEVVKRRRNITQNLAEEIAEVVEIDDNIGAETNKYVKNSAVEEKEMENHEITTTTPAIDDVQRVQNQALSIESLEQSNNSPNESSYFDADADAPTAKDESSAASIEEPLTQTIDIDDLIEPVISAHNSAEVEEDDSNEKRYINYFSNNNREDLSTSDDDEESKTFVMSHEFNSEWADLKYDLEKKDDARSDLSNDIDGYDVIPVDLSNDVAVNDLAIANPSFHINPDAEIITLSDIENPDVIPTFEKLLLSAAMPPTTNKIK